MTIEKIDERIVVLQEQLQTLMANLQAVNGAIQDCEYWKTVLKALEK